MYLLQLFSKFLHFFHALVLFLASSQLLATSLAAPETTYAHCDQTFSCGPLKNITYPFSGGQRPAYCGLPLFQLRCLNDSITELTITMETIDQSVVNFNSYPSLVRPMSFRVLDVDQTNKWIKLTLSDLYYARCPNESAYIQLRGPFAVGDLGELTLFHECFSPDAFRNDTFTCSINGISSKAYFFTGGRSLGIDPLCNVTVRMPIPRSSEKTLARNQSYLAEILREGFSVKYDDEYGYASFDCQICARSGGQCGFSPNLEYPICICNGQHACGNQCSRCDAGVRLSLVWKVMIAIAGAVAVAFVIACISFRRLKHNRGLSKEKEHNQKVESFLKNHGSLGPKRYKYSEVKKITNNFKDKLGQGGYGSVYKGNLPDGRLVAVKILTESKGDGEEFINEVASISRTSHVNIVALMGFCYEKTRRALVYEFLPNGSLDKHIYDNGAAEANPQLEWTTLQQISAGVARGLEYLHQGCNTRILHFDIKPHNILLDEDFCPKIADFGLAKLCQRKVSHVSVLGTRGTVGYIAPEVFSRNFGPVSHKSDVYSFGMLVLEMVGRRKRFKADPVSSHSSEMYFPDWIYKQIEPERSSRIWDEMETEEQETLRKLTLVSLWCIQTIPSDRPSMTKVVEMLEGSLQSLQIPPKPVLSSPISNEKLATASIISTELLSSTS